MIKLYISARKCPNNVDVGIVLLDKDEISLKTNFKVADLKEVEGYLMGIRRGLSYIKNTKQPQLNNNMICIFASNEQSWINLRIREDRYIQLIRKKLHINLSIREPIEEDIANLKLAKQQYISKYNLKNNQKGFTK